MRGLREMTSIPQVIGPTKPASLGLRCPAFMAELGVALEVKGA